LFLLFINVSVAFINVFIVFIDAKWCSCPSYPQVVETTCSEFVLKL